MRAIITLLICIAVITSKAAQTLTLSEALRKRLVTVSFTNIGAYQGRCMKMSINNLLKDSLQIFVPAGTRLNAKNQKEQDILIVKEETILLGKLQQKTSTLKGYCCRASKHAPSG